MIRLAPLLLLVLPTALDAQTVQPGNWDVKSTAVDLLIPGAPGFLVRMMKGKSRTEHKCLMPAQASDGIAALFVPKPEAKCRVERARIAGGRIDHLMFCPQKRGDPLRITRVGTYTADGFIARLTMVGQTPKGPTRIIADQVGIRTKPACRSK